MTKQHPGWAHPIVDYDWDGYCYTPSLVHLVSLDQEKTPQVALCGFFGSKGFTGFQKHKYLVKRPSIKRCEACVAAHGTNPVAFQPPPPPPPDHRPWFVKKRQKEARRQEREQLQHPPGPEPAGPQHQASAP